MTLIQMQYRCRQHEYRGESLNNINCEINGWVSCLTLFWLPPLWLTLGHLGLQINRGLDNTVQFLLYVGSIRGTSGVVYADAR